MNPSRREIVRMVALGLAVAAITVGLVIARVMTSPDRVTTAGPRSDASGASIGTEAATTTATSPDTAPATTEPSAPTGSTTPAPTEPATTAPTTRAPTTAGPTSSIAAPSTEPGPAGTRATEAPSSTTVPTTTQVQAPTPSSTPDAETTTPAPESSTTAAVVETTAALPPAAPAELRSTSGSGTFTLAAGGSVVLVTETGSPVPAVSGPLVLAPISSLVDTGDARYELRASGAGEGAVTVRGAAGAVTWRFVVPPAG